MEKFDFYQDTKITCWQRTHFVVNAQSYEEAIQRIQMWADKDVYGEEDGKNVEIICAETLFDTTENMDKTENGGKPTVEIFAYDGTFILSD